MAPMCQKLFDKKFDCLERGWNGEEIKLLSHTRSISISQTQEFVLIRDVKNTN